MKFVQFFIATILLCPIVVFLITLIICRALRFEKHKAIGLSADFTTVILFLSIPIAIRSLWGINVFIPLFVGALMIAIVFTYVDWRTKKEIEVKPLLKKIWRIYFIFVKCDLFLVWVIGLSHSVIEYMMAV